MNMKLTDMRFKKIIIASIIGIVILIVIGMRVAEHMVQTNPETAASAGKPTPVAVQTVKRDAIEQVIGAEAAASASQLVPIRITLTTGTVSKAYAKLGGTVKQGDILFKLENGLEYVTLASARSALAIEQHDLQAAKKRLDDVEKLNAGGLASSDEVKTASKEYSEVSKRVYDAEVKLWAAEANLKSTVSTAPVSGVVTAGELHACMVVRAGIDLLTLSAIDPIHVTVKLSEDKLKFVNVGQKADVSFYAYPDRQFKGEVALINPTVDETSRLASLIIRLENPKLELMPGMNGVATIKVRREGLRVPAVALIASNEGSPYVFIINENEQAVLRRVAISARADGYVTVASGLEEGERVVVIGQTSLKDNQQVRIGTEYAGRN